MKNKLMITLFLFLAANMSAFAQYSISGKVTNDESMPLTGVNIIVSGTASGAASDVNGNYRIENLSAGDYSLIFSHLGYKKEIINIKIISESVNLDVQLSEEAVESEQVIIAAGKYEQRISELPVSAEILSAEEMTKRNITNLEDVMRYIPGVNMTDDQVSIRGSTGYSRGAGSRVLMTIDGIPYYTGDTGEIIWYIVPVTQLERVEVIKGAASSLYGSSAIGGVINIVTKKISEEPQTYIKTHFGVYDKPSYDEWDWSGEHRMFNGLTISHSNRFDDFGFTLALTRLEDEGYRQSGFYHRYIGYFKGAYNFTPTSSLNIIFNSVNQRNGNFIYWKDSHNALVPPDADQGQRIATDRYMTGAVYSSVLNNHLSLDIKASYYKTHWEDQTTSANNSTTDLFRGEVQTNYSFADNFILVSGVEGSYSNVKSNIFGNPDSKGFGIYSQADVHLSPSLLLSAGARYDYNQLDTLDSFSAFSPKVGLNYNVSESLVLRSSVGTGFRAPSLAEAFTSTTASGITVKPNPHLQPETNITAEAGANYQAFTWLNIDAAIFQNEYYDFIEPGVDPNDGVVIFDNITRARIQGYEVNTKWQLADNVTLSFNYTYLWARDIEKKRALNFRPRHVALAGIDYKPGAFEFGGDVRYASRVEEIDPLLSRFIPDAELRSEIFVLDLRAGYSFIASGLPVRLSLNADNALNYNYVELTGNLAPIRNIALSAEIVF